MSMYCLLLALSQNHTAVRSLDTPLILRTFWPFFFKQLFFFLVVQPDGWTITLVTHSVP